MNTAWWNARYRKYGDRAALDLTKNEEENGRVLGWLLSRIENAGEHYRRVLDFGCGTGRLADWLLGTVADGYFGFETSMEAIMRCPPTTSKMKFGYELPDEREKFDGCVAAHVFQHIPDSELPLGWAKEIRSRMTEKHTIWIMEAFPLPHGQPVAEHCHLRTPERLVSLLGMEAMAERVGDATGDHYILCGRLVT